MSSIVLTVRLLSIYSHAAGGSSSQDQCRIVVEFVLNTDVESVNVVVRTTEPFSNFTVPNEVRVAYED